MLIYGIKDLTLEPKMIAHQANKVMVKGLPALKELEKAC